MQPIISVVIPVYNVEKYLRKCLDSVVNQSFRDIEIILVDDGSTDNSGKICDEYAQNDTRILVIHQENQYVGIARNNGMDIARGEYLIFLDSDDYFDPQLLESLYERALETGADITLCKEQAYYDKEGEFDSMNWAQKPDWMPSKVFSGNDIPERILNVCVLWPWDKLYKISFLRSKDIRFPLDRTVAASEDFVFVGHTVALADKITFINKTLITHRYHSKSLAATRNKYAASLAVNMLYDRLKKANLIDKYHRSFINLTLDHLHWSLTVASEKTYKEEYEIAKDMFRKYRFNKYNEEYFYNKDQYLAYLKMSAPVKATMYGFNKFIRHLCIILQSLYV